MPFPDELARGLAVVAYDRRWPGEFAVLARRIQAALGPMAYPASTGLLHDIAQFLPSYWLVQASRISLYGHGWTGMAWLVIVLWIAVLTALVYRRYRSRI